MPRRVDQHGLQRTDQYLIGKAIEQGPSLATTVESCTIWESDFIEKLVVFAISPVWILAVPPTIHEFFVRVGILGQVGRFRSSDGQQYQRGTEIICRTRRGLEIGQVLSGIDPLDGVRCPDSQARDSQAHDAQADAPHSWAVPDGVILRRQTVTDQLLIARLEKNRHEAYNACVDLLSDHNESVTLMDVEHLFDGRSLYFYFLGKVSPKVDEITQQLAEAYDAEVQFRAFSTAVNEGCGPDCGTEDGGGCGTDCQSCAIAAACK